MGMESRAEATGRIGGTDCLGSWVLRYVLMLFMWVGRRDGRHDMAGRSIFP